MYLFKLFLLLLATFFVISLEDRYNPQQFPPMIAYTAMNPKSSGFHVDRIAECIAECQLVNLPHGSLSTISTLKLNLPWVDEAYFNNTLVEITCTAMNNLKACISNCPEGDLQQGFKNYFQPYNYMCNESSYIQFTTCYNNALENVKMCHNDDKCGKQLSAVKSYFKGLFFIGDTENATSFFADKCDYYNCFFPCIRQPILDKCSNFTSTGEIGYETLKTLFQNRIKFVKKIYADLKREYFEPVKCYKFRTDEEEY